MSNEEGAVSFGFAPHGPTHPPEANRSTDGRPAQPSVDRSEVPAATYAAPPSSSKANWAWLCIGMLLGAGITMIGSSIWLQSSYVSPSVADARPSVDEGGRGVITTAQAEGNDSKPATRSVTGTAGELANAGTREDPPDEMVTRGESRPAKPVQKSSKTASEILAEAAAEQAKSRETLLIAGRQSDVTVDVVTERLPVTGQGDDGDAAGGVTPKTSEATDLAKAAGVGEAEEKAKAGTPSSPGLIYRVQLAAVDDEPAAKAYWQEVQARLPNLFTDIEPLFDRREVGKRIFYRIWIGEFEKRADADDYCGELKSEGQDCFVTRG